MQPAGTSQEKPSRPAGVVAVVTRGEQFLIIRRSQHVRSPGKFCFPGGSIEPGESEADAVVREFREELNALVAPVRLIWRSVTITNVDLAWWLVSLADEASLTPNPLEVHSVHWFTAAEALQLPDLLPSNRDFYAAWERGTFQLLNNPTH